MPSPERPDTTELKALVSLALDEARERGASAAEIAMSSSAGLSTTVRMGEVETVEHNRDRGLGVTVYFGQRKGSASTNDLSPDAARDAVRAACGIARHTAEDRFAGLADAELMPVEIPELDLYHPWALDADQAIAVALEAEDAARAADTRITNSEGATVNQRAGQHVYGNSHGFLGAYATTRHSLSCTVIAGQGDGMQRDYWYSVARSSDDLEPPGDVGRKAAARAVRRLDARQISTRTVPVLYAAEVATGLLGHLVAALRGSNLYRKSSFLLDHLGKGVLPTGMRVHEQPHLPRGLGSCPFDNEGVATRPRDLVSDGVLEGYVLSSYSARKLGLVTTGNAGGVHNLTVEPCDTAFEALVADMGSGLLVTELLGMGVNITTGDYSRGAAGFWVEDGRIVHPVQEVTIAGNLRDMFLGIRAVGNDVETRGNLRTGSILVDRMTVAGA